MRSFMMLIAVSLAACAVEEAAAPYTGESTTHQTLYVWAEDNEVVTSDVVRAACTFWWREGIQCELVADPNLAHIRIRMDGSACKRGPNGFIHYADAKDEIRIFTECMRSEGDLDARMARAVLRHEIGHLLGVWRHVPTADECQAIDGAVCGVAVMNPYVRPEIEEETELDHLAFMRRGSSVLDRPPGMNATAHLASNHSNCGIGIGTGSEQADLTTDVR